MPTPANASRGTVLGDAWSGLTYVLRNRGLRALAVTLSVYNMGQVMGWLVFHERVSSHTLAGAALIVGGCLIAARGKRPERPEIDVAA